MLRHEAMDFKDERALNKIKIRDAINFLSPKTQSVRIEKGRGSGEL